MTSNYFNFCGCRYYSLDAYYRHKLEKEIKKGYKKVGQTERTVFNDEEQRRYVLLLSLLFGFVVKWHLKFLL